MSVVQSGPSRAIAVVLALVMILSMPAMGLTALPVGTGVGLEAAEPAVEPAEIERILHNATGEIDVVLRLSELPDDAGPITANRLQDHAISTQEVVVAETERRPAVTVLNTFWITNAILVRVDTDRTDLEELGSIEGVEWIHPNFEVTTPEPIEFADADAASTDPFTYGLEQINVPETFDAFDNRGDGVRVAVLDTGVDPDHPDITIDPADFAYFDDDGDEIDGIDPHDTAEHGTHVSGTVVGGNASGTQIGAAPNATLMHGVAIPHGSGTFAQIAGAMEWAIDEDAQIISMSLGSSSPTPALIDVVDNAEAAGVIMVAAVGNDGHGTSGSPASERPVLSIGATDEAENVTDFSGGQAIFSPGVYDGEANLTYPTYYTVPDFSAPGDTVLSAVPGGGYATASGTSMATPHVSGVIALMLSNSPHDLDRDAIDTLLAGTSVRPDGTVERDTRYGQGIVDAYAATSAASATDLTTIEGTVTDQATGEPVPGATVRIAETGEQVDTAFDGAFQITTVAEDTVTIEADLFRFEPNATTVDITPGDAHQIDLELTDQTPYFHVAIEDIEPDTVWVGESVDVTIDVWAIGGMSANKTVEVHLGDTVHTETLDLDRGDRETISTTVETTEADAPSLIVTAASEDASASTVVGVAEEPSVGDGTSSDPYQIDELGQLPAMTLDPEAWYVLGADLDASDVENVRPIRDFAGAFDGQGHTIDNLTIHHPDEFDVGLFGSTTTDAQHVRDLALTNVSVSGHESVGGVIGSNVDASIQNVTVSGSVVGDWEVGGIVGGVDGAMSVEDASFTGEAVANQTFVGGAIGLAREGPSIERTTIAANVTAIEQEAGILSSRAGGIVGQSEDGLVVRDAIAAGVVSGGNAMVGGMAGVVREDAVFNNVTTDVAVHAGDWGGGGIVGVAGDNLTVVGALTTGDVSAGGYKVGGVVGQLDGSGWLEDVETTGAIETEFRTAGGIVGEAMGNLTLVDAWATGNVTGEHREIGGLVGFAAHASPLTITNATATGEVTGHTSVGGAVGFSGPATIEDVAASGNVTGTGDLGGLIGVVQGGSLRNVTATGAVAGVDDWIGGLVGNSVAESVVDAAAHGDVAGDEQVGGLLGSPATNGTVHNATATGDVTGTRSVGGLIGGYAFREGVNVTEGHAAGNVTGEWEVGGLIGTGGDRLTVRESSATGAVWASDTDVGGLVGILGDDSAIDRAFARGDVMGEWRVGGLIGATGQGAVGVVDAFATGNVTGDGQVGGLVGHVDGGAGVLVVETSFAVGNVSSGGPHVGALVGDEGNLTVIEDAYWDVNVTGQSESAAGGVGLTTAEMTGASPLATMEGLDFDSDWTVTEIYPVLTWDATHAFVAVENVSADPGVVELDDPVTISANLTNHGVVVANQTIDIVKAGADEPLAEIPIHLAAGESTTVIENITFDTAGEHEIVAASANDTASTSVIVEGPAPDISVVDAHLDADEIEVDETVNVTATLENAGDGDGEATISLTIDETSVATLTVSVEANETETVTFTHTFEEVGTFEVAVDGVDAGTVTVDEPPAPAEFVLANLDPATIEVTEGDEPVDIAVDVENVGEQPGEQDITLTLRDAADDIVGTETIDAVEVAPDASTTVTFEAVSLDDLEAGTYTHEVTSEDDAVAGTITVEAPPPADFQLANLDPATVDVTEGDDPIDIAVDVENVGEQSGVQDLVLAITDENDTVVYSQTVASVELGPSESDTVTFADVPVGELDVGEYTHTVSTDNDSVTGTIDVASEPVSIPDELPGFGIAIGLLTLLVAALAIRRIERTR